MAKLTASQIANKIEVSVYTVKRWYDWYSKLSEEDIKELKEKHKMPELPECELIGATNWRYWDEKDIEALIKFKEWVPNTRNGIFNKYGGKV